MMMSAQCRGCTRFHSSELGTSYQFVSEPGWEPLRAVFDNDKLAEILRRYPREVHLLPHTHPVLPELVGSHEIFEEHIEHVDETLPIYLGNFPFTNNATGKSELFQLCTDGHHRAAKCMKLKINIPFYFFNEAEMKSVRFKSMLEYMNSKGIFVLGIDEDEVEKVLWES